MNIVRNFFGLVLSIVLLYNVGVLAATKIESPSIRDKGKITVPAATEETIKVKAKKEASGAVMQKEQPAEQKKDAQPVGKADSSEKKPETKTEERAVPEETAITVEIDGIKLPPVKSFDTIQRSDVEEFLKILADNNITIRKDIREYMIKWCQEGGYTNSQVNEMLDSLITYPGY